MYYVLSIAPERQYTTLSDRASDTCYGLIPLVSSVSWKRFLAPATYRASSQAIRPYASPVISRSAMCPILNVLNSDVSLRRVRARSPRCLRELPSSMLSAKDSEKPRTTNLCMSYTELL